MNELVKFEKVNEKSVPATTSKMIAKVFGKEHFHVIRDIETYIESGEFNQSNFGCSSYISEQGKETKMYILDEDFTAILIMGFTGKEALKWKKAYQTQFREMREQLTGGSKTRQSLTTGETFKDFFLVAETLGLKKEQAAIHANHATRKKTSEDVLALMEIKFETEEKTQSVTNWIKDEGLKITARKANEILFNKGFLKGEAGNWELTEKGKSIGKLVSQEAHGKMRESIEWTKKVIDVIK